MTQTIRIAVDDTLSPIRALNSLTSAQANQIVAGLSSLAQAWDIERHESCDGHLSLLVSHAASDTTIIFDRDQIGMRVSTMLGDVLQILSGRHDSTAGIVATLKQIAGKNIASGQRHSA